MLYDLLKPFFWFSAFLNECPLAQTKLIVIVLLVLQCCISFQLNWLTLRKGRYRWSFNLKAFRPESALDFLCSLSFVLCSGMLRCDQTLVKDPTSRSTPQK